MRVQVPRLDGIGDLDLVLITVATLFEPVTGPPTIGEPDVLKVLRRPVTMAQTTTGSLVISSNRDRKEIVLSPNKIDVRDTTEDIATAKESIPGLMRFFWELLGNPQLSLLGVNFVLESESQDTQRWLADKSIGAKFREKANDPISSKSVSLTFDNLDHEWTISFSAPTSERLSVNFNASRAIADMPDDAEISASMDTQYAGMLVFLAGLN